MSIGIAILGGGIFAREEHLPAVKSASQNLTLKAVYSRSLKSAQSLEAGDGVDLYSDDSGANRNLEALLARDDIQAVIIALPIRTQPEYIKKALAVGKHVLSEKPIAESLAEGEALLNYHRQLANGTTWSVAENNRYLATVAKGRELVEQRLGKLMSFVVRVNRHMSGGKYFETAWRKTPEYQGGFLLDGGIHQIATLRKLLGADHVTDLASFSAQLRPYLPPVDTLNAALRLKSGVSGSLTMSYGTTFPRGDKFEIAGEHGSVVVDWKGVTFTDLDGNSTRTDVKDERTGVPPEVRAWGEALAAGKQNKEQSPEEGLADLELLEKMLRSGENGGAPQQTKFQVI